MNVGDQAKKFGEVHIGIREMAGVLGLGDASIKSLAIYWRSASGPLKAAFLVILFVTSILTSRQDR